MIARARDASEMLKALSHESRLVLLCILAEGEKSVTELEQLLGERQSTVSQQIGAPATGPAGHDPAGRQDDLLQPCQ